MACNTPMLAVVDGFTSSGSVKYIPLGRYTPELAKEHPGAIKIPCGKCRGCRANKARIWADRMILELDHSKKAVFLTLTYNNEHVPIRFDQKTGEAVLTLNKRDLQLFFKRLRKRFPDKELRYYACGEYGQGKLSTHRPHYHIILFGLGLEDFKDLQPHGMNELKQPYWISDFFANEIWKNGFCIISEVSWNTCAYVARYVKKKDMGLVSDEFVDRVREPEFSVSSRNPGIGLYYPKEHPGCFEYSVFHFGSNGSSVKVFLPPAFLRGLKESKKKSDNDLYEALMEQRKKSMLTDDFNKLYQTDLDFIDLGDMDENSFAQTEPVLDFYRQL